MDGKEYRFVKLTEADSITEVPKEASALAELEKFIEGITRAYKTLLYNRAPNRRVAHLIKHGKRLTRKKNIKRVVRYL